jgi:hypothetical protein
VILLQYRTKLHHQGINIGQQYADMDSKALLALGSSTSAFGGATPQLEQLQQKFLPLLHLRAVRTLSEPCFVQEGIHHE